MLFVAVCMVLITAAAAFSFVGLSRAPVNATPGVWCRGCDDAIAVASALASPFGSWRPDGVAFSALAAANVAGSGAGVCVHRGWRLP